MKRLLVLATICVASASLCAQSKITPLNVNTGLWQFTTVVKIANNGVASQPRTTTRTSCLTFQELLKDPFSEMMRGESEMSCTRTLTTSTASDEIVDIACRDTRGNSSRFHLAFHAVDRQHVTGGGSGDVSMYGHNIKSNWEFKSQWQQSSCPAAHY